MPVLEIGPSDGLYYEYDAPSSDDGATFVFVNPITGDCSLWQGEIGPALRAAGHGTLVYNFRGQAKSPFNDGASLDENMIREDLARLVNEISPPRPIAVGLSIGGLYAAKAHLAGTRFAAIVLINTLRRMSPRIDWMNELAYRAMTVGGPALMKDVASHVVTSEPFLAGIRGSAFPDPSTYKGLAPDEGMTRLVDHMRRTDWTVDYAALDCPVLVMTGHQDRVFFDAANVDALFGLLRKGYRLDLPQAGHMIPAERPKELIMALIGFAAQREKA